MDENTKNRLDGLMKIAEYWASRHDGRREYEWKVALGCWGLLLLAINYVHVPFLRLLPWWQYALISISTACALLLSFVRFWLYPLWKANRFDKEKTVAAVQSAEQLLDSSAKCVNDADSSQSFIEDWSMRFQTFTTTVLLIALCVAARF